MGQLILLTPTQNPFATGQTHDQIDTSTCVEVDQCNEIRDNKKKTTPAPFIYASRMHVYIMHVHIRIVHLRRIYIYECILSPDRQAMLGYELLVD